MTRHTGRRDDQGSQLMSVEDRTIDDYRLLAVRVRSAHRDVHRLFGGRDRSPEGHELWAHAAAELQTAMRELYSDEFEQTLAALRDGDAKAVDPMITFLEADPFCWGSGYITTRILQYLRRHDLTSDDRERLRRVLLRMIDTGGWEFPNACRLARTVGNKAMRDALVVRLDDQEPRKSLRALRMLLHVRRRRLAPNEIVTARQVLVTSVDAMPMWAPSWLRDAALKLWSPEWVDELGQRAASEGPGSRGAGRILNVGLPANGRTPDA